MITTRIKEYLQAQLGNPEGDDKPNKNSTIPELGCGLVKIYFC